MDLHLEPALAAGILALAVAAYGLSAAVLNRYSVSAAFAFLVIGAIVGGAGMGLLVEQAPGSDALGMLAEITLALVLFSAASTVRLKRLESDTALVGRLLVIGLPLTIALGAVLALLLFPGVSFGMALLIGAILAPTDADLGHQVISDTSVPARVRRLLNVESGLNDGIAAPVVAVAVALAAFGDFGDINPVVDSLRQLAVAVVVGVVLGAAGRWLLIRTQQRESSTASSRQLATLALALAAYLIAAGLDASGFIAAFSAGLAFGVGSKEHVEQAVAFTEAQSVLLSILVWLVFGLVVVEADLLGLDQPVVIVYAVLALTVARMVPVAIAYIGTGFDRVSIAFMGWFGPRGLASVIFVLLALDTLEAAGVPSDPLGPVVSWIVVLSVVLHGFSARGLAGWYGRYTKRLRAGSPELLGEEEPRRPRWTYHGHDAGSTP